MKRKEKNLLTKQCKRDDAMKQARAALEKRINQNRYSLQINCYQSKKGEEN